MRFPLVAFLPMAAALLSGQIPEQSMPRGIVRGSLVNAEGTASAGSIVVQKTDGSVYGCTYDAHTFVSRNDWPIHATELATGVPLEIVSDRMPGTGICYARILRQVDLAPLIPRKRRADAVAPLPPVRRATLIFAGLVIRSDARSVTIKGRGGDSTLLLRSDTSFSDGGQSVDRATPLLNRHVFVRAGQNLEGQVEAYQVFWGQILAVR